MDVRVHSGSAVDLETPMLVVNLFEGMTQPGGATAAVDAALGGTLVRLIADGEIGGELGQVAVVHVPEGLPLKARRVAVAGLGRREKLDLEAIRIAAASAARKASELKLASFATVVHGAGAGGIDPLEACRLTTEASILALYRNEQYKSATRKPQTVASVVVVEADPSRAGAFEEVCALARTTCDSVMLTRDLSVGPSNVVTPTYLADEARRIANKHGLDVTVWDKDEMRRRGMNGILAVNKGSAEPPVFVVLRYRAEGARKRLAVVGKGITFDSGGISIKPADHMEYMRHDMSGAATVLGFVDLAASARLPVNVLGIFPATENLPSGSAYKPGDVFTTYSGKTIEVVNTDAEGRVILSDALAYAVEQKPDAIVDLATLTGACVVALGHHATGLMTNDQALADLLIEAGVRSGERLWQLPMWPVYERQIETAMADIKNTGGRPAGAITAAKFLEEFVDGVPWAHLDIAGTAYADGNQKWVAPYNPKAGATGVGVRLLWHFCHAWKDR